VVEWKSCNTEPGATPLPQDQNNPKAKDLGWRPPAATRHATTSRWKTGHAGHTE
jgi:hypothetical protein